jgi:hypothetical protein
MGTNNFQRLASKVPLRHPLLKKAADAGHTKASDFAAYNNAVTSRLYRTAAKELVARLMDAARERGEPTGCVFVSYCSHDEKLTALFKDKFTGAIRTFDYVFAPSGVSLRERIFHADPQKAQW